MVNIKFIAKKAGVSVQTVSNVINNKDSEISKNTKEKILKLLKKYDYRPNKIARSLQRGHTKTIGLLVPDIVYYPIYPVIFDYIENILYKMGFNVLIFNTREDLERENDAINSMIENNVDGIIFIRIIEKNLNIKKISSRTPIVACLRGFEYLEVPSVLTDNKKVGFLATDYLIQRGHKKIIHIAGNEDLLAHRERKAGYIKALQENNLEVDQNNIFHLDYLDSEIEKKLEKTFLKIKGFTAIFAYIDTIAIQCIKILKKNGFQIPRDVSIIGVDNLLMGDYIDPPLTSIKQPLEEICQKSIDLIVDLINGKDRMPGSQVIYCDPEIIEKESVASAPK